MKDFELEVIAKNLIREKMIRFKRLSRMDMVLGTLLKEINEAERIVDGRWLKNAILAQVLIRTSIFVLFSDIERYGSEPDKKRTRDVAQATHLFIEYGVDVSIDLIPSPKNHQELNYLYSSLTGIDYENDPKMKRRRF